MGYIHIALSAMKGDVAERQKGLRERKTKGGKKIEKKGKKMRIKGWEGDKEHPM